MNASEVLQKQAWGNLSGVFNQATDLSKSFGQTGHSGLDQAAAYFKTLLSGNRTETEAAAGPAVNAAQEQSDAAKAQQSEMGTSRGGGTSGPNQQRENDVRAQIDKLIGGLKPAAATGLAGVSEADINAMMTAMGIGAGAAGTLGGQVSADVNSRRAASAAMWSALIGGAASLGTAGIAKP